MNTLDDKVIVDREAFLQLLKCFNDHWNEFNVPDDEQITTKAEKASPPLPGGGE